MSSVAALRLNVDNNGYRIESYASPIPEWTSLIASAPMSPMLGQAMTPCMRLEVPCLAHTMSWMWSCAVCCPKSIPLPESACMHACLGVRHSLNMCDARGRVLSP